MVMVHEMVMEMVNVMVNTMVMVHEMVMAMVMVLIKQDIWSIPMIALWCPSFSNHVMHEAQQLIILIIYSSAGHTKTHRGIPKIAFHTF